MMARPFKVLVRREFLEISMQDDRLIFSGLPRLSTKHPDVDLKSHLRAHIDSVFDELQERIALNSISREYIRGAILDSYIELPYRDWHKSLVPKYHAYQFHIGATV